MTVESGIFSLLHRIRQMFSSARKQGLVVRKQTPSQTSESAMTGNAQSGADVDLGLDLKNPVQICPSSACFDTATHSFLLCAKSLLGCIVF